MKRLLVFLFLFATSVYAQDISVRLSAPLSIPKYFSDLLTQQIGISLTFTNIRTSYANCQLDVSFYFNGILIARTIPCKLSPFLLQAGSQTSPLGLVFPAASLEFTGEETKTFSSDSKLSAGNYKICVSIQEQGTTISEKKEGCTNITIYPPYVPVWVSPADESIFFHQDTINFSWVKDSLSNDATYRLQMYEIMPKQTAIQAAQINNHFIDTIVSNTAAAFTASDLFMKIEKKSLKNTVKKIAITITGNNDEETIPSPALTITLKNSLRKEKK